MSYPTFSDAVRSLAPDATFSVDHNTIVAWISTTQQPTHEQIMDELSRLIQLWNAEEWKRNRQNEYPSLDQLIVALWEQVIEGRPATAAQLQALREEIKQRYPKPT